MSYGHDEEKRPAHALKYSTLLWQRTLIWAVLIGLNAGTLVLALKTFHHIWLLTLILYMKSKDVVSCLVSLAFVAYHGIRSCTARQQEIPPKWVLSWVSAYCETEEQISKTLTSICNQELAPHRQVVCISLDGKPREITRHMTSVVGSIRRSYLTWKLVRNEVTVTAGYINDTPVLCLEKAYNAGKKDSLVLCHDLFSALRDGAPAATKALRLDIWTNLLPKLIQDPNFEHFYGVFMTDADSTIHSKAVNHLTEALARDTRAIAACGVLFAEMTPGAEWSTWHLFQQFQYSFGQYIRRRAEGYWGKVTCLPGCISMTAVRPEMAIAIDLYAELVTKSSVFRHQVQYLGTDRRLTYCMLAADRDLKTVFVPHATCETVTPQTLRHYLSQRRRWGSNSYFNNFFYCFGPNQALVTRFWALVDILRMTLVYYRVANTIMFLHGLIRHFALIKIIPLLVVTQLPTVWFLMLVLFQEPLLRRRAHKLVLGLVVNKIIAPILSIVVFTKVLLHIGSQVWGHTGSSTAKTSSCLGMLGIDAARATMRLETAIAEKFGHKRSASRDGYPIAWMV